MTSGMTGPMPPICARSSAWRPRTGYVSRSAITKPAWRLRSPVPRSLCFPSGSIAFIGRGYETAIAALPQSLLGSRLHIGHSFPPDAIVPAIRSADVGLVLYEPRSTNYRYALPNGFFQAVAAGLPLVCARPWSRSSAQSRAGRSAFASNGWTPRVWPQPSSVAPRIRGCCAPNADRLARELSWRGEAEAELGGSLDRPCRSRSDGRCHMSDGVPAFDAAGLKLLPPPLATPLSAPHERPRGAAGRRSVSWRCRQSRSSAPPSPG